MIYIVETYNLSMTPDRLLDDPFASLLVGRRAFTW
jgi:hypothetical protein